MRPFIKLSGYAFMGLFCLTTLFGNAETVANDAITEPQIAASQTFRLPDLSIDAERATYQGLISRPQDEINPEKIELKAQRNPIKLLHAFNSSVLFDGGLRGATLTPSMRGFAGKHTTVALDGCPINTGWNGTSPLSGFPLNRIKKVIAVPGGAGLLYGPNSVAGAVNFVLPTARDLEGFTLTQEIGSEGTRHQEYIYGRVAHQNEHLFALFLDDYEGSRRFKNFDIAKQASDNLGTVSNRNDNASFMYRGRLELDCGTVLKATILENHGSVSCPSYYERFDPWNMSLYDYAIEKDFGRSNLSLRYAKYKDFSSTYVYNSADKDLLAGTLKATGDCLVKMDTMELLYNIEANAKNYVTVGAIKQTIEDIGHGFQTGTRKKVDTTGYFVNDSIKATDKLKLNLTGRSDTNYEGDAKTSWSLSSNYDITERTSFGFGLSNVIRNPNMQELYRASGTIGNPNLTAEDANNLELRLGHKLNDQYQVSLAMFKSDIDNYIAPDGARIYQNIQKVEIAGVELSVNGKINNNFDAWIGYTDFSKARNKTIGARLENRPDFRAVAGTTYHSDKLSAMLSIKHQGETKAILIGSSPYQKVAASTLVDLNLRQQMTKDFAMYIKVDNLTDQDDVQLSQASGLAIYNNKNILNLNSSGPINYEPGRMVSLGMELKFR